MAAWPPAPTSTIDWSNIGFKARDTHCHIESTYTLSSGKWTDPVAVADPVLKIHGLAPGLNYGQHCFEGLKAFRTPAGSVQIFRPDRNAERMARSGAFIAIPDLPAEHFQKCVHMAVALNADYVPPHESGGSMYIRPLLFGEGAQLGLDPPENYRFVAFVMPSGVYHGVHPVDCLVLEDYDRSAPEGTGSVKVGGNYAPPLIHMAKAKKEGFGITMHLDSKTRTEIDEFSTSAFIGLQYPPGTLSLDGQKVKMVLPSSKNIIKSVTANSVAELAESLGWEVEYRTVMYTELPSFQEVVAAGTAAALVPIRSITMKGRGDKFVYLEGEEPGPGCLLLLKMLRDVQFGRAEDKFGWCQTVEKPAVGVNGALNKGIAEVENPVNEIP